MLCADCQERITKIECPNCGKNVYVLGQYCYECGNELPSESEDFESRILCSDETCIGTINENGICNVCGKPYSP
ncbi:MAG: hypothetical protein NZ583_01910 [Desulfobacterota bacterium]|nr:hypothetical protein [Thermodesulfobacteriota bacterium]MDW8001641.1 hypothetical protein [Deltaproteobacteria bacterium]